MFNNQALRTEYISLCFQNERKLNHIEFLQALAAKNVFISEMTAMLVADVVTTTETAEVQELATVW